MKAVLIDPSNKSVTNIERDDDYRNIAPLIGADSGLFTTVADHVNNAVLYVDDEGLLVNPNPHGYFKIGDYPGVLAGKGLLVGTDGEGGDCDVPFDASRVKVEFIDNPDAESIEPKMEVMSFEEARKRGMLPEWMA